jgi:1-acyl-sn-glycerol-3-phosphate acyltransferase
MFYWRVLLIVYRGSRVARRGAYGNERWGQDSLSTLRALEGVGVQLEVSGLEHLRSLEGPCVFIANHMSTLETFVFPCILLPYKEFIFVVKKSLVDYPVFGHIMRSVTPITVGRMNPREDLKAVLEGGASHLGEGRSVTIFPQTTRSYAFDASRFNTIGIKLARKAGAPVIPVALKTDAWGTGRVLKDFGRVDPSRPVRFAFGPPMEVKGRGDEEHRKVIEFISTKLLQWGVS